MEMGTLVNRQWDYEHLWEVVQHQLLRLLQHQYQKPNVSKSSRLAFRLPGLYRLQRKLQLEVQSLDDQWTRQSQLENALLLASDKVIQNLTKCSIMSLWHRFLNEFVNSHIVSLQSWTSVIPTNNTLTCVNFFEHLKKCFDRYIDGQGVKSHTSQKKFQYYIFLRRDGLYRLALTVNMDSR